MFYLLFFYLAWTYVDLVCLQLEVSPQFLGDDKNAFYAFWCKNSKFDQNGLI